MSTAKWVLVVFCVLLVLGTVGRMDYDEAKRTESARVEAVARFVCVRLPMDGSAVRSPATSERATALLVKNHRTGDAEDPELTVLRCAIKDD